MSEKCYYHVFKRLVVTDDIADTRAECEWEYQGRTKAVSVEQAINNVQFRKHGDGTSKAGGRYGYHESHHTSGEFEWGAKKVEEKEIHTKNETKETSGSKATKTLKTISLDDNVSIIRLIQKGKMYVALSKDDVFDRTYAVEDNDEDQATDLEYSLANFFYKTKADKSKTNFEMVKSMFQMMSSDVIAQMLCNLWTYGFNVFSRKASYELCEEDEEIFIINIKEWLKQGVEQ